MVHKTDPDMIAEACIFEIVATEVGQVPIPSWVFAIMDLRVEQRIFATEISSTLRDRAPTNAGLVLLCLT